MKDSNDNLIVIKTKAFALRCIRLYKYLIEEKNEYVMSRQMLKSGTSIGANIKEAIRAQSKADFIAKMNISLKEASETEYWIELLRDSEYVSRNRITNLLNECVEIIKIITSIIKNSSENKQ